MIRAALIALCFTPFSAWAEGTLSAAGRIETVGEDGSCSAVLVRADLIATAAHCASGKQKIFRPGDGRRGPMFTVSQFIRHPLYEQNKLRRDWQLRFDIAIGKLEHPVPRDRAVPVALGLEATLDEALFLVSWRKDGTWTPRQRRCPVIDGIEGLVTLACQVQGGESGAPLFRKTEAGLELVAIISSRSFRVNQPIAQASDVALRLPPLIDMIDAETP